MIDSPVVLFPQPDSPTMPTHSPSATSNDTPSTATTEPVRMRNSVRRFSTCRTGAIGRVYSPALCPLWRVPGAASPPEWEPISGPPDPPVTR